MLHSTLHLYLHNYYSTPSLNLFDLLISSISQFLYSLFFSLFSHFLLVTAELATYGLYTAAGSVDTDTERQIVARRRGPWANGCWRPLASDNSITYFEAPKYRLSIEGCLLSIPRWSVSIGWPAWASKSLMCSPSSDGTPSVQTGSAQPFRVRYKDSLPRFTARPSQLYVLVVRGEQPAGWHLSAVCRHFVAPNMMMIWVLGTVTWTESPWCWALTLLPVTIGSKIGILVSEQT